MEILNSTLDDVTTILKLYDAARSLQKAKLENGAVVWPEFDETFIAKEINTKSQWKMLIDGEVACVWMTTFSDPQIWEDRNTDPAVYIHRIATNPAFRGRNLVAEIVAWSKQYAAQNHKKYVRLDTVGENHGLVAYYQKSGFDFLGFFNLKDTVGLPAHYNQGPACLFEIVLD